VAASWSMVEMRKRPPAADRCPAPRHLVSRLSSQPTIMSHPPPHNGPHAVISLVQLRACIRGSEEASAAGDAAYDAAYEAQLAKVLAMTREQAEALEATALRLEDQLRDRELYMPLGTFAVSGERCLCWLRNLCVLLALDLSAMHGDMDYARISKHLEMAAEGIFSNEFRQLLLEAGEVSLNLRRRPRRRASASCPHALTPSPGEPGHHHRGSRARDREAQQEPRHGLVVAHARRARPGASRCRCRRCNRPSIGVESTAQSTPLLTLNAPTPTHPSTGPAGQHGGRAAHWAGRPPPSRREAAGVQPGRRRRRGHGARRALPSSLPSGAADRAGGAVGDGRALGRAGRPPRHPAGPAPRGRGREIGRRDGPGGVRRQRPGGGGPGGGGRARARGSRAPRA